MGWGTKFTSEAMFNIGMPPQLVFAIHIGTNLIVAKHNTKVKNVNNMKDLETTLGLKPEQIQDLMKRTGKNLDDFAKIVKNGELDSLLGIPEMNMKYLMKQTGKNADEIADWLKRNDIDLKDINPKNVDDIIKGASGATYKSFDNNTFDKYIDEVEDITGRKITDVQHDKLQTALKNNDYTKLSGDELKNARNTFNKNKTSLISEWEKETGQKCPRYTEDVLSEKTVLPIRKKGELYDAHHIVELSKGGDNSWWNLHPAKFPKEHQGGIHGSGSSANKLFK